MVLGSCIRESIPSCILAPPEAANRTNGKGSTIAFCRAILEAAGFKVHTHTSPHLVNWHERFRLGNEGGGRLVSDAVLESALRKVADANGKEPATVFELLSAAMFVLFSEHPADYSLIEVGLGGRFDATNVVAEPLISVITPISLDHQSYLGDTLAKIAFEKAGIIKPAAKVVSGRQNDEARQVLQEAAESRNAPHWFLGQDFDCYLAETGFVYQDEHGLLDLPLPALRGEHQLENAGTAIAALRFVGLELPDQAYATGIKKAVWPGRFERLPTGNITQELGTVDDVWIDGGHNPSAGIALSAELANLHLADPKPVILICGMINTKDCRGFLSPFDAENTTVISVPVSASEASVDSEVLANDARACGLRAEASRNLQEAVSIASRFINKHGRSRVLFCGSLYFAGEVLEKNGTVPV